MERRNVHWLGEGGGRRREEEKEGAASEKKEEEKHERYLFQVCSYVIFAVSFLLEPQKAFMPAVSVGLMLKASLYI